MLLFTLHTYLEELLGSYGDLLESLSWSTRTDQAGNIKSSSLRLNFECSEYLNIVIADVN